LAGLHVQSIHTVAVVSGEKMGSSTPASSWWICHHHKHCFNKLS